MRRVIASTRALLGIWILTAFLTALPLAHREILAEPAPDRFPDILGDPPPDTGPAPKGIEGEAGDEQGVVPDRHWSLRAIDFTHKVLSQGVEAGARGMDSFFTTEEAMTETTASFVKVSAGPLWIEGEGVELAEDFRARLDLPGTQRRLKLFAGQDPLSEEEENDELSETAREEARRDGFGLGLEGQLRPIQVGRAQWRLLPAGGVKIKTPPDPFLRFRTIRRADYGRWASRWSTTTAQFLNEGLVARTRLDWDRPLGQRFVFRSGTRADWADEDDVLGLRERLTLFHRITPDNRMAYEAEVRADDDPEWQVDNYLVQLRYRNRFYKKWLFFELRPRLSWPRENDFGPRWSVLMRFEAVFGYGALSEEQNRARAPAAAKAGPLPSRVLKTSGGGRMRGAHRAATAAPLRRFNQPGGAAEERTLGPIP